MAGAFVQIAGANSSTSAGTSITVSLSGTTANNLLIGVFATTGTAWTATTPDGWVLVQESVAFYCSGAMYYRIADGTETSVTFTWTNSVPRAATVCEYSGLATSSPLEDSGENETYVNSTRASGGTVNSGSATPVTANGMAIACAMGSDERHANETELSIDSGYTINDFITPAVGAYPIAAIASLAYSSTAAQSPTWDTSLTSAWRLYATIGVFKEPAAGGAAGIRNPLFGPMTLRTPLGRAA